MSFICGFDIVSGGKPTGKIFFVICACAVRVRNNGGSNISKREINKLWREFFPNCAPVSLGEQRILIK